MLEGDFSIIQELGGEWKPDGYELCTLRYVLEPLYNNNLPSSKNLYELYLDCMAVHEKADLARAHLWFGLSVFIRSRLDPLEKTFKSDVKLEITEGDVLYRKMLAEAALELDSKAGDSKTFIQYVTSTKVLANVTAPKFMPPQEKQKNDRAFIPYILDLFKEADKQCVIEPDDLSKLIEWLKKCGFIKIAKKVAKFNAKPYEKDFTACREIPVLHRQCTNEGGEESSSEPPLVGSQGIVPGRSNSATEESLASYVSDKRQKFKEGKQESGSRDETKQELATDRKSVV